MPRRARPESRYPQFAFPLRLFGLCLLSLLLPILLSSPLLAQRYVPAAGEWATSPGPLASGSVSGGNLTASGSLAEGGTSDSGFFLHRPAGEGDDFRICLGSHATTGVSGLMVRDSADPDAAFAFLGLDPSGEAVLLFRQRAGESIASISFGPPRSHPWLRLLVGRGAVYAYDAAPAGPGAPGAWNFLTAVKVDLVGGGYQERREDIAGLFVSDSPASPSSGQSAASFTDLYQSEFLFWSERTATALEAVQVPPASWSSQAPGATHFAESGTILQRDHRGGAGSAAHLEFPVTVGAAGSYRFLLHVLDGNPASLEADLVVNGTPQGPTVLANEPPGLNSWFQVGGIIPLSAGATVSVRLFDPGTAGSLVIADAARAVLLPASESGSWQYPGWTRNPISPIRVTIADQGAAANRVDRNDTQLGAWNAGAHHALALIGDSKYQFRFTVPGARAQVGLGAYYLSNDPTHIDYRFAALSNGHLVAVGSTIQYPVNNTHWLEIERIGQGIFFRRIVGSTSTLIHRVAMPAATSPATPLHLDLSLFDEGARVAGSRFVGHWTSPAYVANLDADGIADSLERWLIDADPEDAIQSIYDIATLSGDTDGDGLSDQEEHDLPAPTNPTRADSDGDGLSDGDEVLVHQTDPLQEDSDGDGLGDYEEINIHFTEPNVSDSDDDEISDGVEVSLGLDANQSASPDLTDQLALRVYSVFD